MIALKANGINAEYVPTGEEAKAKVLSLIPSGCKVMTMTSVTVDTLGLSAELNNSPRYESIRKVLSDPGRSPLEKSVAVAGANWVVGSVHAVTESGHVFVASNTGSQLPAYAYNAPHVIWLVSTKKIVADEAQAFARIYDHVLPLESERAKKAYGAAGSFVSKVLIVNREVSPDRLQLIFIGEDFGF